MFRVLTPNGILEEVETIIPVKESRFVLNNYKRRLVVKAHPKSANGVVMVFKNPQSDNFGMTIGNLTPEVVYEIMRKLLKDTYFDLSTIEFQKRVETVGETICDGGKGLAYASCYIKYSSDNGVLDIAYSTDPYSYTMEVIGECDVDSESDGD